MKTAALPTAEELSQQTGLSQDTIQALRRIFAQFKEIEQAILYGSRAKGTYRKGSDIDITLKGEAVSHRIMTQIEAAVDDLLLPYQVDLSALSRIDDRELLNHISRVGIVFYTANKQK